MTQDFAETVALQALGWLVGHDELLPVFLGATGVGLDALKARAGEPELLISVLDFLCMDDAWIAEFCGAAGLRPEVPMQARQALPGGGQVHWT